MLIPELMRKYIGNYPGEVSRDCIKKGVEYYDKKIGLLFSNEYEVACIFVFKFGL